MAYNAYPVKFRKISQNFNLLESWNFKKKDETYIMSMFRPYFERFAKKMPKINLYFLWGRNTRYYWLRKI